MVEKEALRGRAAWASGAPVPTAPKNGEGLGEVCANYENYAYLTTV